MQGSPAIHDLSTHEIQDQVHTDGSATVSHHLAPPHRFAFSVTSPPFPLRSAPNFIHLFFYVIPMIVPNFVVKFEGECGEVGVAPRSGGTPDVCTHTTASHLNLQPSFFFVHTCDIVYKRCVKFGIDRTGIGRMVASQWPAHPTDLARPAVKHTDLIESASYFGELFFIMCYIYLSKI
jgi:hypothetical protein